MPAADVDAANDTDARYKCLLNEFLPIPTAQIKP